MREIEKRFELEFGGRTLRISEHELEGNGFFM